MNPPHPSSLSSEPTAPQPLGLVAGWGSFPVEIAQRCLQAGHELHIVGLHGHADPQLTQLATRFRWMGVAKLGGHIRFFQQGGIEQVALAGKLFKARLLYQGRGWLGLAPDWTCIRSMAPIFVTRSDDARDDSILGRVVAAYASQGIRIMTLDELAPQLVAEPGVLAGRAPNRSQWADIRFGWRMARQMGALDIGQSVTIKDQLVLGVEAIEGTDALIARTSKLCPRGGFSLVKVAKPHQDKRFDMPTVGPRTVQQMAAAGGSVIAVQAHMTILVDRQQTLDIARRLGVSLVAVTEEQLAAGGAHAPAIAA